MERSLVKDGVVALGEATGHCHKVEGGKVWKESDDSLTVEGTNWRCNHQEHDVVEIPPTKYTEHDIVIVREMDHINEAVRRIAD